MKKVIMLFVGALLVSSALAEDVKVSIPSLGNVQEIFLTFHSTSDAAFWYLGLSPDGGGGAGIAGGGDRLGYADEGTFSFGEIYNLLVPHLKPGRDYVEDITVFFTSGVSPEGKSFGGGGRLEDPETIGTLIRLLRDKMGIRDTGQMDDMFQKRPLFPGYDADGNPIPGYVRKPYLLTGDSPDVFADTPKQPQTPEGEPDEGGAATPPPQPTIQEKPPEPPAIEQTPAVGDNTTTDIAEGEPSQAKNNASNRWLFAGIILALATVFYLLRRRK